LDEAAARTVALMLHQEASAGAEPPTSVWGSASALSYEASLRGLTVVSGSCEGRLVGSSVRLLGGAESDRARFTAAAHAAGLRVSETGTVVRLLGPGSAGGAGDVVVSLDTPYALASSHATTRIALYGRTREAFSALVDVLTGRARGQGRLPVPVDGLPPTAGCA
jgi:beta-N-acetylhexosaminidase